MHADEFNSSKLRQENVRKSVFRICALAERVHRIFLRRIGVKFRSKAAVTPSDGQTERRTERRSEGATDKEEFNCGNGASMGKHNRWEDLHVTSAKVEGVSES